MPHSAPVYLISFFIFIFTRRVGCNPPLGDDGASPPLSLTHPLPHPPAVVGVRGPALSLSRAKGYLVGFEWKNKSLRTFQSLRTFKRRTRNSRKPGMQGDFFLASNALERAGSEKKVPPDFAVVDQSPTRGGRKHRVSFINASIRN